MKKSKVKFYQWISLSGIILPALTLFMGGCTVTHTYLKKGYDTDEKIWLKRVALTIERSTPPGNSDASSLYLDMAAHHISHHGEYLVPTIRREMAQEELSAFCKNHTDLDGIIIHRFSEMEGDDKRLHLAVHASLMSCKNQNLVWEAKGSSSFARNDSDFTRLIASYKTRYGETAERYAAPFYGIIRKLYESLPNPILVDEDLTNKIELDASGPARE